MNREDIEEIFNCASRGTTPDQLQREKNLELIYKMKRDIAEQKFLSEEIWHRNHARKTYKETTRHFPDVGIRKVFR